MDVEEAGESAVGELVRGDTGACGGVSESATAECDAEVGAVAAVIVSVLVAVAEVGVGV